jgi:hypothetical protein
MYRIIRPSEFLVSENYDRIAIKFASSAYTKSCWLSGMYYFFIVLSFSRFFERTLLGYFAIMQSVSVCTSVSVVPGNGLVRVKEGGLVPAFWFCTLAVNSSR